MARINPDSKELQGLSREELLKLARSKKISVSEATKKDELISKLDAVMKLGKLKKLVQAKPRKAAAAGKKAAAKIPPGVPLPLAAKGKKKAEAKPIRLVAKKPTQKLVLPRLKARGKKAAEIAPTGRVAEPLHRGKEEEEIEEKKYYVPPTLKPQFPPAPPEELPSQYGRNRIVLLARDPEWVFSYWEVTSERLEEARQFFGGEWERTRSILRVYDVTNIDFNGSNAHSSFDIELKGNATNWYIHVGKPDRSFIVDIARISPSGKIFVLARSNAVRTPRSRPSDIVDEEWMSIDFEKLYGLSGGLRIGASSAEFRKLMEKGLPIGISSASGGIFSAASPVKKRERGFWFVVDAELIVYGATDPAARVWVQGKEVPLRPDGTFTLRFALPDGLQHIPATAESPDKIEERTITIDVSRKTAQKAPKFKEKLHA